MVRRHSTQFLELSQPNLYLQAGNTEDWSLKLTSPRKRNYRWGHSEFSNEITNFSHDYPSLGTTSLSSGTSSNHLVSTFLLNKTESHFRETTNIKEISKQTKEKELEKKKKTIKGTEKNFKYTQKTLSQRYWHRCSYSAWKKHSEQWKSEIKREIYSLFPSCLCVYACVC